MTSIPLLWSRILPCPSDRSQLARAATIAVRMLYLRAAAVYIRAAFENRMKSICEKNGIQVGYKENPKQITADALWRGILFRHAKPVKKNQGEFIDPNVDSPNQRRPIRRAQPSEPLWCIVTHPAELAVALQTVADFRNSKIPFVH
jgi:hypothetical protein